MMQGQMIVNQGIISQQNNIIHQGQVRFSTTYFLYPFSSQI